MTKPLSKLSGEAKKAAIKRRVASKTGGLGHLSAVAAVAQGALNAPKPEEVINQILAESDEVEQSTPEDFA